MNTPRPLTIDDLCDLSPDVPMGQKDNSVDKRPYEKIIDPRTQAERVLSKFGGARRLSRLLSDLKLPRDPATIYKWTYGRDRGGTGGLIPTSAWPDIFQAAKADGVLITPDDMDPRPRQK